MLLAALASERDICLDTRAFGAEQVRERATDRSDLLLRPNCSTLRLPPALMQRAAGAAASTRARCVPWIARARNLSDRGRKSLPWRARSVGAGEDGGRGLHPTPLRPQAPTERRPPRQGRADELLRCVLAGFPDRVVRRRAPGSPRGVMVGGTGVALEPVSVVRDAELFVAVEVGGGPRRGDELRVRVASAIEREWLEEMFPHALHSTHVLEYDAALERVVERRRELFHDLVLAERTGTDVDRAAAGVVLAAAARRDRCGRWRPATSNRTFSPGCASCNAGCRTSNCPPTSTPSSPMP